MKILKLEFLNGNWHSLSAIVMLLFLTIGCEIKTNEEGSEATAIENVEEEEEEVEEEVIDNRFFEGCARSRNPKGDEAYMSITPGAGEKYLEGICFGKKVYGPIWTGKFTGEVVSSDTYLFKIEVEYQINGETITVKEKWKKVDDFIELIEADSTRPDIPTDYLFVNCFREFAEQQAFVDNMKKSANIKAAKKYYQAIDVNGSVILELEYYDEIDDVTGTILAKVGENETWYGLVSGRCIDGRTDSLAIEVEYFESDGEYWKHGQTWQIDKADSMLSVTAYHSSGKPGNSFIPINLPNGFPDKDTFKKNYKDYHNEID